MPLSRVKWFLRTGLSLLLLITLASCASLTQAIKNEACALDPAQPFDVVRVDLEQHDLRLFWKQPDGMPFLTIDRVQAFVAAQGDSLVAATNAGIYEPGYIPTGLYIEDGVEMTPLNLDDGRGNFFLKPNGVFFVADTGAHIVEASQFPAVTEPVRLATQSGPLLVADGVIHPAFTPGSENCRVRSGVGVTDDGIVYLVLSSGGVSFHDFATFFRDTLGAPNALYLDGGISDLYAPTLGRTAASKQKYAGILAVVAKQQE